MAQGSVRCSADTLSSLQGMEGHRASVLQPTKRGLGPSLCFMKDKVKVKSLSHVQFFVTPWTVAYQAPPSMGFSEQEYGSGLPFPSPEDLPSPGSDPGSPILRADTLPSEPSGNERQKQNPNTRKKPSWHKRLEWRLRGRQRAAGTATTERTLEAGPSLIPSHPPPPGRLFSHPPLVSHQVSWLFSFSRSVLIRNKINKSGPLFLIKWFLHSEPFSPGRHPDSQPWRARPEGDLRALTAMPGMLGPTAAIRRFSFPCLFHRLSGRITHWADCVCVRPKSLQLCPVLCDPMLGSSVHGILQARTLEWVAMPSSRGSHSQLTEETFWMLTWSRYSTKPWWADTHWYQGAQGLVRALRQVEQPRVPATAE